MDEAAAVPDGPRSSGGRIRGGGDGRAGTGDTGRIEDALTGPLVQAVRDLGGYGGLVYLRSRDRRSLVLAMVTGVPRSLLKSWWRVPVGGALPMAEAYRRDETLWLPDERATMVRFPHFTAGLPYSFGSAHQPLRAGGEPVGVLVVLRSAARTPTDAETVALALRPAGRDMEERLGRLAAGPSGPGSAAHRVEYDGEPVGVRLPTPAVHPVRVGLVDWDLDTDRCTPDDEALALLGLGRADFGGTLADIEARVSPDDLHELRACRHDALTHGRVRSRHFRVRDESAGSGETGYRPVELWGHLVGGGAGSARILVAALVDAAGGLTAAEAAERLPDGIFSLDQDGRLTYANRRCEELLGRGREELLGRCPWEVVTWLRDPAYEDRYRAAMLSQEQVSFLVRRPDGNWLSFVLYPDVHGLTGRVSPTGAPTGVEPGYAAGSAVGLVPGAAVAPPPEPVAAARAGALYHVVQMASVLTEAVTVRDVCRAVSEQLLPAFGARELALYTVREGRMYLLWESGYPEGFLTPFEGVTLDTQLPGVHALTTRLPLFFESPEDLSVAYPGIALDRMNAWAFLPLIASGHPVGSCILGWDTPHRFTADERSALTALSGLAAQALERARLYDAESAVARGLQEGLLPHRLPAVEGLRTAGRYLPGTQGMAIGGDWYDVIRTGRGVALIIGDVEGHSVGAAAVMGQLRSAVHAFAASERPPQEVITHTNRLLTELESDAFATCCYVELDPRGGRALAVRAGHPPPLLRHPDGHAETLDLAGGVMLGVQPDAVYPVTALKLAPGSVLALYTDGLVERPGSDIETGIEQVRRCLADTSADSVEHLADRLMRTARRATERPDDVALLLTAYR
ncbi:SpoIIE family protein phosphatase [Streptomyces lomondensis]|uniref:Diguanylate cyclase n=1 Tax=Streptomyces lomondensis TaxID=68229 RepID=A0ABQ2XQ86_9ACTN|nr:SpoIIE family protein phosphatase [Streptomyces lomondensis]MCF0080791.1 SpoIIE family protein phosphatase [Streptomyces lomondensis]GGX28901.1 diguanylate cyclase [Streptomyces lomondensis]